MNKEEINVRVDIFNHFVRDGDDNRARAAMPGQGTAQPSALQINKAANLGTTLPAVPGERPLWRPAVTRTIHGFDEFMSPEVGKATALARHRVIERDREGNITNMRYEYDKRGYLGGDPSLMDEGGKMKKVPIVEKIDGQLVGRIINQRTHKDIVDYRLNAEKRASVYNPYTHTVGLKRKAMYGARYGHNAEELMFEDEPLDSRATPGIFGTHGSESERIMWAQTPKGSRAAYEPVWDRLAKRAQRIRLSAIKRARLNRIKSDWLSGNYNYASYNNTEKEKLGRLRHGRDKSIGRIIKSRDAEERMEARAMKKAYLAMEREEKSWSKYDMAIAAMGGVGGAQAAMDGRPLTNEPASGGAPYEDGEFNMPGELTMRQKMINWQRHPARAKKWSAAKAAWEEEEIRQERIRVDTMYGMRSLEEGGWLTDRPTLPLIPPSGGGDPGFATEVTPRGKGINMDMLRADQRARSKGFKDHAAYVSWMERRAAAIKKHGAQGKTILEEIMARAIPRKFRSSAAGVAAYGMDRYTWMMRAGSSLAMRTVRFAGLPGLASLMVFSQNAAYMPAFLQFIVRMLTVKGAPFNQDAVRAVGTITRDTMTMQRQRERDMGEDPLLLAYTNGFSPPDSYYTSQESVDRVRVQLGTRDYDHVGTREAIVVPGAA